MNFSAQMRLTTAYFYGKGAARLGLKDAVTQKDFSSVFQIIY